MRLENSRFVAISLIFVITGALSESVFAKAVTTATDVYETVDLLHRSLDIILERQHSTRLPDFEIRETGLGFSHVYQIQICAVRKLQEYQLKRSISPIPLIVSRPMDYSPQDVIKLSKLLLIEVRSLPEASFIQLPSKVKKSSDKNPTDLFRVSAKVYMQLLSLNGEEEITSNQVYAQIKSACCDVESVLCQIDSANRFRFKTRLIDPSHGPADVVAASLACRRAINGVRSKLQFGSIPIPVIGDNLHVTSADAFIQTQLIIAELNLLKLELGNPSSAPLPIAVDDKSPAHVYQQASKLEQLIKQIIPLRENYGAVAQRSL